MTRPATDFFLHVDTLGLRSDAIIIGLGCAWFNRDALDAPTTFYWPVSAESNGDRSVDAASIDYWLQDSPYTAASELTTTLLDGVTQLHNIYDAIAQDIDRIWVWNWRVGGTILDTAHEQLGLKTPWQYFALREGRTFCDTACQYRFSHELPTPYASTAVLTIERRVGEIQAAHQFFTEAFARPHA